MVQSGCLVSENSFCWCLKADFPSAWNGLHCPIRPIFVISIIWVSAEPKDWTGNRLLYGLCMRFVCIWRAGACVMITSALHSYRDWTLKWRAYLLPPLNLARTSSSLVIIFCFTITTEKTIVGRARNSGRKRNKIYDNQIERGEMKRRKVKLLSSSCGHGRKYFHSLQIPVCRIHLDKTK